MCFLSRLIYNEKDKTTYLNILLLRLFTILATNLAFDAMLRSSTSVVVHVNTHFFALIEKFVID